MKPPPKNRVTPVPAVQNGSWINARAGNEDASTLARTMQQAAEAYMRRDWANAERLCRQILNIRADHFDALTLLGIIAAQTGHAQKAVALFSRAADTNPNEAAAHSNLGNLLRDLRQFDAALDSLERALTLQPDHVEALNNRGIVLQELNRTEEALDSYDLALKLKPDYAEAHLNRGVALKNLGRFDQALTSIDFVLRLQPNHIEGLNNRGLALMELKRLDEALASFDRALQLKPDYAEAHLNRGVTLKEFHRLDEALDSYVQAIRFKPNYAEAHYNRGNALYELKRSDEALDSYQQAIALKPGYAQAYQNRGDALREAKRLEESLENYAMALKIKPDSEYLYGLWLHTKMLMCDWNDAEIRLNELSQRIQRGEKATPPFPLLALTHSLPLQRKAVEIWVNDKCPDNSTLPAIPKRTRHDKIRIGYYSADFREHPVAYLMAGIFETHDKSRFECTAFSYGRETQDGMRKRVESAFDNFIDARNQSDKEVALLSRNMGIDIAVDLGGFTQGARTGVFAMRAAPLQVSYIGYLGTMGANYMDYLIADKTIIPDECRPQYSEKIVFLPSYQANDSKLVVSERCFTRAEIGLPDTGFIFCCFNSSYKITPATFDGWMRILRQVEGSVLLLYAENEWVAANLKKEAVSRGISADRLVFGKPLPRPEHLARYRVANLFLDTLPCNAGTTASDALWAGLPLLTCVGQTFPGRVAASLLNAIDLPELITTTPQQYEALAVELATHPQRLQHIRQKLERNRLTTPLFDTPLFTQHIEAAYTQIYERYQNGLPPDHIHVM